MTDRATVKAERVARNKFLEEGTADGQAASRVLQAMLEIREGTSMQSHWDVWMWCMPNAPPSQDSWGWTMREMQVHLTDYDPLGEADAFEDETMTEDEIITEEEESQAPGKSRAPRCEQTGKTRESDTDTTMQEAAHSTTASPPFYWHTPATAIRVRGDRPPIYWRTNLSTTIINWMEQPGTKSKQVRLSRLELRSAKNEKRCAIINAADYKKVELIQFNITPNNEKAHEGYQTLNWLVLQVSYKPGSAFHDDRMYLDDDEKRENPARMTRACKGKTPYWIMAFPVEAVTGYEVRSGEKNYVQKSFSRRQPANRQGAVGVGVRTTILRLGPESVLPLLHGLGIDKRFLEGFMDVCAVGLAEITMESEEEVPLQLL